MGSLVACGRVCSAAAGRPPGAFRVLCGLAQGLGSRFLTVPQVQPLGLRGLKSASRSPILGVCVCVSLLLWTMAAQCTFPRDRNAFHGSMVSFVCQPGLALPGCLIKRASRHCLAVFCNVGCWFSINSPLTLSNGIIFDSVDGPRAVSAKAGQSISEAPTCGLKL